MDSFPLDNSKKMGVEGVGLCDVCVPTYLFMVMSH